MKANGSIVTTLVMKSREIDKNYKYIYQHYLIYKIYSIHELSFCGHGES